MGQGHIFTGVYDSVHVGGGGGGAIPACIAGGIQHALHRGGSVPGGVPGPGGVPAPRGVPGGDPPGRLLLRAVRILLECILVTLHI